MKITPGERNIGQLLSIGDSADFYRVPAYQRNYSWTERYWEDLITDIEENEIGYFIGTFITVENDDIDKVEVLDGQQRLTTLSILKLAIFNVAQGKYDKDNDDDQTAIQDLRRSLVEKKNNIKEQRLELLERDNSQFRFILKDNGLITDGGAYIDKRYRNLIIKAYEHFVKRIQDYSWAELNKLIEKVSGLTTVKIKSEEIADAYSLFEALNGKSFPLTIVDLLKLTYFQLEPNSQIAEKKWNEMMMSLETDDTPTNIRFILNNYRAFAIDYGLTDQTITKASAIKKYQDLLKKKGADFIDELIENARIFTNITKNNKEIKKIKKLDISQIYPLLMYVIKHKDEMSINDSDFELLVQNIGSFFVRRNVSNNPQARDVARMVLKIIQNIKGKQGNNVIKRINKILKENTIDDDEFYELLLNSDVYEITGITKYMLSNAENTILPLTKGNHRDFDEINENNHHVWQIEHIMPQNDSLRTEWIEMLISEELSDKTVNEQRQKATEIQGEYLHKLGNLTITAYNPEMSDLPFEEKINMINGNGINIGLNNGLWLNESVVCNNVWTSEEIKKRTKLLAKKFVPLFSI